MTDQAKKRLTHLALGAAAVLVVLAGWALFSFSNTSSAAPSSGRSAQAVEWYTIKPISFDVTVLASGELEARNQIEIKCKVTGQTAIISLVDEGTRVKAGDVLAKLDDKAIKSSIEDEDLRVVQARADKSAADTNVELARQDAASAQRDAEVEVKLAKLAMEKWRNGDVVQKQRELKLSVERAQRKLEIANRELKLDQQLWEQNFISQNDLKNSELAQIEAEDALVTAKQNVEIYNTYTHEQEMQEKTNVVNQAESWLVRTISQNELKLSKELADQESKTRTLQMREDHLAELKEELANTTVLAPSDGMVVYATSVGRDSRRSGSDNPITQGRSVRYDETIFLLPDTSQMVATLRVHESLMPQIRLDQRVTVSIDARAEPIEGRVLSIGVMAETGGWFNPQLREYLVRVALPQEADSALKPAMRCKGTIFVGRVTNALAVPIQAVNTEGNRRFVYVPADGSHIKRQDVTIGRSSETYVEISSGLDEGARVLLRNPKPGEVINERGQVEETTTTEPAEGAAQEADSTNAAPNPAPPAGAGPMMPGGNQPGTPAGEQRQRPPGSGGGGGEFRQRPSGPGSGSGGGFRQRPSDGSDGGGNFAGGDRPRGQRPSDENTGSGGGQSSGGSQNP
ncbi:MAG: HlyD family efflux transporter periplasmic adaptor subunit [Phycisphaeraceae bacterium]|nr:HlyD family efflux transporter periplasmic adaptor subunit [Phycisphaeraceae bacterium]